MEMTTHALAWFDIPVTDFERAKSFYSKIFDFEMPSFPMGSNMMGIFLYDQAKGGIGGAIVQAENRAPSAEGSIVYLNAGSDLNVVLDRVEAAGGSIVMAKMPIGDNLGFMAYIMDPEGNRVGLHSPN